MQKENQNSGAETAFKDKDGKPICYHSYIKDGEGNHYFINSHCQAVPKEGDAPAVELSRLIETSEVSVITAAEVLEDVQPKRRQLRKRAHPAGEVAAPSAAVEKKPEAPPVVAGPQEPLQPVSLDLVLKAIPDDALASELRSRGYTLCAVKPALITV